MSVAVVPQQKRVTISSKRQFTIPQRFFTEFGFDKEAVCTMAEGMLIIEPAKEVSNSEFSEQILADLIAEGYEGQELLIEFKNRQSKIRPAVERLIKMAKDAANGIGEYAAFDEVFGGSD